MKTVIILLGLIALGCSAPQPRKLFHEHVEDFLEVISQEAAHEIEHLFEHYVEFDEFTATMDYIGTTNFKQLVYEMESLPEFKAVMEFLEKDNIDVYYFIDRFNDMIGPVPYHSKAMKLRHELSGRDLSAYIKDTIEVLPQKELAALFEQKKNEDEDFKVAVENLESEEWIQLKDALWANEVFQKEVKVLADNGIDVSLILIELKAFFGQL